MHPRAINIIQSARNMHKRERGESEMQLMLRMHKKYVSNAGIRTAPSTAHPPPPSR